MRVSPSYHSTIIGAFIFVHQVGLMIPQSSGWYFVVCSFFLKYFSVGIRIWSYVSLMKFSFSFCSQKPSVYYQWIVWDFFCYIEKIYFKVFFRCYCCCCYLKIEKKLDQNLYAKSEKCFHSTSYQSTSFRKKLYPLFIAISQFL